MLTVFITHGDRLTLSLILVLQYFNLFFYFRVIGCPDQEYR